MNSLRHSRWFETIYRVGIAIKGFDGAAELFAGLSLLLAPSIVHQTLISISGNAIRHSGHAFQLVGQYVAHLDKDLAKSGLTFLIVFLIGHGLVKLVLVYCLLKRIVKVYPYALAVLVAFLAYQLYADIKDPLSIGLWLFTLLDFAIIYIVWGEYQDLREKHGIIHTDAKDTSVL